MRPDVGRRPVRPLVALDPPDRLTGARVERGEKRLGVVVVHDVEPIAVEHRRGRCAPAVARLERPPAPRPEGGAVHVECEDAELAKVRVDALAVGHRRLRCVAVLEMARRRGRRRVKLTRPAHVARLPVEGVQHPPVRVARRAALAAQVESRPRRLALGRPDHRRHEDDVTPDDGRAPPGARDRHLPNDVVGRAPGVGQARIVGDAAGAGASKLGPPLSGCGRRGAQRQQSGQDQSSESGHRPQLYPVP